MLDKVLENVGKIVVIIETVIVVVAVLDYLIGGILNEVWISVVLIVSTVLAAGYAICVVVYIVWEDKC